jgi:hypothetical protein
MKLTDEGERSHWQRHYEAQTMRALAAFMRHFKVDQVRLSARELTAPGATLDITQTVEGDTFVRLKDTFQLC